MTRSASRLGVKVKARREIVRSIILRATIGGVQLEPLLSDLKKAIVVHHLDDDDRNLLKVIVYDIRTVVGGWGRLSPEEQKRFAAGKGAPSSLAVRLKKSPYSASGVQTASHLRVRIARVIARRRVAIHRPSQIERGEGGTKAASASAHCCAASVWWPDDLSSDEHR